MHPMSHGGNDVHRSDSGWHACHRLSSGAQLACEQPERVVDIQVAMEPPKQPHPDPADPVADVTWH